MAERHYGELRVIARRMAGRTCDGDDLLQEAFLAAVKNFGRFEEGRSFVAWMRAIIRHRLLRYVNDRRRREVACDPAAMEGIMEFKAFEAFEKDEGGETERVAMVCVQGLPEASRVMFELFYLEGMSARAVGERVQRSEGAVRLGLYRGRLRLREEIGRRLAA